MVTKNNENKLSRAAALGSADGIRPEQQARATLWEQAELLNLLHESIFLCDLNGAIRYWNRAAEQLYGWTAEEAAGRLARDLLKTVFPASLEQLLAELPRTGRWEGELVHTKRDGSQIVVTSRWSLQRDKHGAPVAVLATNSDITKQKRAEKAARQSEKELRDLIETMPAMAWSVPPDGGAGFVSRRWIEYTGLSAAETAGSGWQAAVHPEDIERHEDYWFQSVTTGVAFEYEARFRRAADGVYRWFLVRAVPLRDDHGDIVKWYGILTDIEDRKRTEAYLAEAQKLTHTGSWAWDPSTSTVFHRSEEMFRIYGWDLQAGVPPGDTIWEPVHPEDRDWVYKKVRTAISQNADHALEYRILLRDGTVKHIQTVSHPVLDAAGRVVEYVGTSVDITERKRLEEERERLRQLEADLAHINRVSMMGELAASLGHEIKQPITAIAINARVCQRQLERETPEIKEACDAISKILGSIERITGIIDRNRSLYRRGTPQREPTDVNEIIEQMVVLLQDRASRHFVSIRTDLDAALPTAMADRVQLQQVLMNLMLNGIEAMKDESGELGVVSRKTEDGQLLISVSDSGIGLPAEEPERIFEAFFTTKPQGTGMGLSISRRIIESHGGHLWANPNRGRGATFQFTLPSELMACSLKAV